MKCPGCDGELDQHQQICDQCGRPLDPPPTEVDGVDADTTGPENTDTTGIDTTDATGPESIDTAAPTTEIENVTNTQDDSARNADVEAAESTQAATSELALPTTEIQATELPPPIAVTAQLPTLDQSPPAPTTQFPVIPMPIEVTPSADASPRVFDGSADISHFPEPREPFRLRIIFLLSVFAAAAMLMTIVANVIDIRTTRPVAGIATGSRLLEDFGSNLPLAGFVGAAVLVIGSLLACFGFRWGAGLAGGAGLALVGWAALSIGLAELPIASAESITRTSTSPEPFTLRVTRDIGWWLIVGLGTIGLIVFLASLRWISTGRRAALNPLVAALAAVALVVLAFGPLVPVGTTASFADNFRSTDPMNDLPAAFFAGRLGQVALIVFTGVIGMLIVRSYGLGLAVGGVSVSVWLWVSSYAEIGPTPIGIAQQNPGAGNTLPHAVTTVGMVTSLMLLLIAAGLATWRLTRSRPT